MLLFVGLGNPGLEYQDTRHNMGFSTLDLYCKKYLNKEIERSDFHGKYLKIKYHDEDIIFIEPQTYMNLSGECVREIVKYFKIDISDIIVIYDDMDLDVGKIRLRSSGSSGGHKGIKNIIENLKTEEIKRIRIGIGKAPYSVIDYVLEKPSSEQKEQISNAISKACLAIEDIIVNGFNHAMSHYN